jgi:hypothetical protein
MNEILYQLCRRNVSIMDGWLPVPARSIAKCLNLTVNQARYQLRKLKKLGYVKTISELLGDEDDMIPYHGWAITDKAEETEEYKKAWKEERALCKKCFDIGEQE